MKKKTVYGLGASIGATVEFLIAAIGARDAEAAVVYEQVDTHWHAGVWEWRNNTAWWCFGYAGWHYDQTSNTYWAADVFADGTDPGCYADNVTPRELRLNVNGWRPGAGNGVIGIAYVSHIVSGSCDIVRVRLVDWLTGVWLGHYYYFHSSGSAQNFGIWGNSVWYWNSKTIGNAVTDWGCGPWVGVHAHQKMPVQAVTNAPNGNLYTDSDGKVWHLNNWIHGWIYNVNTLVP